MVKELSTLDELKEFELESSFTKLSVLAGFEISFWVYIRGNKRIEISTQGYKSWVVTARGNCLYMGYDRKTATNVVKNYLGEYSL